MGFQNRQAAVAFANDDLRAIDLGWNGKGVDLNSPGVPWVSARLGRGQRVELNRVTAASGEQ
ncbi:hypothetical protein D3C80_1776220 [compost metagenome]